MNYLDYINNKTNVILKTSINNHNRTVVANIIINELTSLIEQATDDDRVEANDISMLQTMIDRAKTQLYSDVPLKLKPYCIECCHGKLKSLDDPYVLALLTAKSEPWQWEDNGIVFLEMQGDNKYITYDNSKD